MPAEVIRIGEAQTEGEKSAIAHFRDALDAEYTLVHSMWLHHHKQRYEIDLIIVAPHAVYLVDAKHIHGNIEVIGGKWHLSGRPPQESPLHKLDMHARYLKGLVRDRYPRQKDLKDVFFGSAVLLTVPEVQYHDSAGHEAPFVKRLQDSVAFFTDPSRVPDRFSTDIRPLRESILEAIRGKARPRPETLRFREWIASERLGGDSDFQDYRGHDPRIAEAVRIREFRADPYLPQVEREKLLRQIATAYIALMRLRHPCIVRVHGFFPNDEGDGFVLVTEEPAGESLALRIQDGDRPFAFGEQARVIREMLAALAHAHARGVVHRQVSPAAVLTGAQTWLIGFEYARAPRVDKGTIASRIRDRMVGPYVAPECYRNPAQASARSDVFSAGLVFFEMLAGRRAFETPEETAHARGVFPCLPSALSPGVPQEVDGWLQALCAFEPADRPDAAEALRRFEEICGPEAY